MIEIGKYRVGWFHLECGQLLVLIGDGRDLYAIGLADDAMEALAIARAWIIRREFGDRWMRIKTWLILPVVGFVSRGTIAVVVWSAALAATSLHQDSFGKLEWFNLALAAWCIFTDWLIFGRARAGVDRNGRGEKA